MVVHVLGNPTSLFRHQKFQQSWSSLDKAALSHISKHCLPDARSRSFSDHASLPSDQQTTMSLECRRGSCARDNVDANADVAFRKPLGSYSRTAPSGLRMSMPAVLSHTQVMGPMLTSNVGCWIHDAGFGHEIPGPSKLGFSPSARMLLHVSSAKAPNNQPNNPHHGKQYIKVSSFELESSLV